MPVTVATEHLPCRRCHKNFPQKQAPWWQHENDATLTCPGQVSLLSITGQGSQLSIPWVLLLFSLHQRLWARRAATGESIPSSPRLKPRWTQSMTNPYAIQYMHRKLAVNTTGTENAACFNARKKRNDADVCLVEIKHYFSNCLKAHPSDADLRGGKYTSSTFFYWRGGGIGK